MIFNKNELFPDFFSDRSPTGNIVFRTGEGKYKEFVLPDGTFVKLGGNTIISFCTDEFNKTKREVELMQGETSFETVENPNTPFVVRSKTGSVTMKSPAFKIRVTETGAVEIIPEEHSGTAPN